MKASARECVNGAPRLARPAIAADLIGERNGYGRSSKCTDYRVASEWSDDDDGLGEAGPFGLVEGENEESFVVGADRRQWLDSSEARAEPGGQEDDGNGRGSHVYGQVCPQAHCRFDRAW